jgi:hypothetical protein
MGTQTENPGQLEAGSNSPSVAGRALAMRRRKLLALAGLAVLAVGAVVLWPRLNSDYHRDQSGEHDE